MTILHEFLIAETKTLCKAAEKDQPLETPVIHLLEKEGYCMVACMSPRLNITKAVRNQSCQHPKDTSETESLQEHLFLHAGRKQHAHPSYLSSNRGREEVQEMQESRKLMLP